MIDRITFQGLWPSPLAERELVEFERTVSDHVAESLRSQHPPDLRDVAPDLKRQLRDHWDRNDLPRFVGVASILHRARRLNSNYQQRLAWALLTQRRFAEAADLNSESPPDDHHAWFTQARAFAGAGRFDEAAAAATRSAEFLAAPCEAWDVEAEIKLLDRRRAPLDLISDWPATRARVKQRLEEGRRDAAKDSLQAFFRHRADILSQALGIATDPPLNLDWTSLYRSAGACLLLGLPNRAAEFLQRPPSVPASAGDIEETAPVLSETAAHCEAELLPGLLETVVALSESSTWRPLAEVALQVLRGTARSLDLGILPRPPAPVTAAIASILARADRLDGAIMLLGELARGRNREALRSELAACQSAVTRNSLVFRTVPQCGPRQIFDLFPYNGEIELLRIKLHEMSPWVDRFVIVEAATTFSGHPKPLYFASHSAQIEPFLSKISYVPIENFPEHVTSAWAREFYQRDQAIAALDGCCGPNDLLLLTDVDEVLERRAVVSYRGEGAPVTMHRFRFFLNYRLKDKQHGNASIWRGVHLERWGSSFVRAVLAGRFWHQRVPNAGWHFTSVGDANDITRKLASYAHQEHNRPSNKATYASVLENIRAGEVEPGWEVCKDELLPVYVQERPKCLEHLFLSRGAPQPALKSARAGESA